MTHKIDVRTVVPSDLPFLWDMLWEAAAVDAGMHALGRDAALKVPSNRKYLADWGRAGDIGVIAIDACGTRLGAAWIRLFPVDDPAYAYVAEDNPELAIGVRESARRKGVGSTLIDALLVLARDQGFRAVSLGVDRQNPARRLYERVGFRDAGISPDEDSSVTMVMRFASA